MRLQSARGRFSGTKAWPFSANAGAALEEKKKVEGWASQTLVDVMAMFPQAWSALVKPHLYDPRLSVLLPFRTTI